MAETNTIANLDNISSLAYNDVFAIDDLNDLDIFGAPITKNVSALQLSNYINRSFGAATFIANCDLAQTTNLTATYANGTLGVGATLTNSGTQAALSVDGVTVVVGYRILVGGQTTQLQNGIYTVTTVGTASTNWVLTRATDYDQAAEIALGTFTSIVRSTLAGRTFIQANTSITVGTSSIVFQSLQSVIMSTTASLAIGGTGGNFFIGTGGGVLTLPTGVKTIYGSGENVTYGVYTFTNGSGTKTGTTAADTYLLTAYDVDGAASRTFGTATAGNTPSFAWSQPAGGTMTWDGGVIGGTTKAAGGFTTLTTTGLVTNTIGTGASTVNQGGSLFLNSTSVANVGAGEDTLMTNNILGNTLVTTGQYFEWEIAGTNANNINSKVLKAYFGGTLVLTLTFTASLAGSWKAKITITRTGSSAQTWITEATRTSTGGGTAIANTSGTCNETETAAITMRATGEAVSDNDIIQTKSTVKTYGG